MELTRSILRLEIDLSYDMIPIHGCWVHALMYQYHITVQLYIEPFELFFINASRITLNL